jgi:hypothetical protein
MFTSLEKSPSLVPMGSIYVLDLSYNKLEGDVPIPTIRSGRTDIILDYSNNYFNSILPNVGRYWVDIFFFATKEELCYMIARYINTLQALWITK